MIINVTKKILLLLSVILLNSSMFGMFLLNTVVDTVKDTTSQVLVSQKGRLVTTVLVPAAVVGGVVLAKEGYIESMLQKISLPQTEVLLGGMTAGGIYGMHVLTKRFDPEKKIELYQNEYGKWQNHTIFKKQKKSDVKNIKEKSDTFDINQTQIKQIVDLKDPNEQAEKMLAFVLTEFNDQLHKDVPVAATFKAATELSRMVEDMRKARRDLKNVGNKIDNPNYGLPLRNSFKECKKILKSALFVLTNSKKYREDRENDPAHEKNNLAKQQITYTSTFGSLMQMLQLPALTALSMVLLQQLLNTVGLEYRVL
jgi:hypothetical protein